jgi:hypothetical protein
MSQPPKRRKKSRGQAMVEYSMINWLLIVGLVLASTVKMIPGPKDSSGYIERRNLIEMFLDAYQRYYDSFYYVLNMPFP